MANSFATKYNEEIVPALTKKFNYTSSMQVPKKIGRASCRERV